MSKKLSDSLVFSMPQAQWRKLLCVRHAMRRDDSLRPHLMGVLIERESAGGRVFSVATDGTMLACHEWEGADEGLPDDAFKVFVPLTFIDWFDSRPISYDIKLELFGHLAVMSTRIDDVDVELRAVPNASADDFPAWRKIMPKLSDEHSGEPFLFLDLKRVAALIKVFADAFGPASNAHAIIAAPIGPYAPVAMRYRNTTAVLMPLRAQSEGCHATESGAVRWTP